MITCPDSALSQTTSGSLSFDISSIQSRNGDPLAITFNDLDHSIGERRLLTFGETRTGRSVVVSHTWSGGSMRIISARLMTGQERKIYEEG